MSTWAWIRPSADFHHRILPWRLMHAPVVGPYLLGRQAAMPGRGIYLSTVDHERYTVDGRDAYEAVLANPDERRLTWLWPRSIPLGLDSDITTERFRWLEAGAALSCGCRPPSFGGATG